MPASVAPVVMPVVKLGKFKASKLIVKESWAALMKDKEIIWFPVLYSVTTLFAIIIMAILFFVFVMGGSLSTFQVEQGRTMSQVAMYGSLFVYYVVIFFIVNFFQSGLFIIVQGRFSGQDMRFADGINGASNNIHKIFLWSLISATVGVILRIIADKSKLIGKIVASLFGAAWNILTFFSLPSLVIGNMGIKDSFKDSASMIRKTWGETIIINFGVSLFFALIIFAELAFCIGVIVLAQSFTVAMIVCGLFALSLVVLMIISSTLDSIFKLALYDYARTGVVPTGFTPEVVQGAITAK